MRDGLSAEACRKAGCRHLTSRFVATRKGTQKQTYCRLSGRIPGNMSECPMELIS